MTGQCVCALKGYSAGCFVDDYTLLMTWVIHRWHYFVVCTAFQLELCKAGLNGAQPQNIHACMCGDFLH